MAIDGNIRRLNVGQEFQSGINGLADWGGVFPTAYANAQIARWLADGIENVAFAAPGLSNNFVRDTLIPIHLQFIELIAAAGINIDWGAICGGNVTPEIVDYWVNSGNADDHVTSLQNIANTYGVTCRYIVANETEASWNQNTSWTVHNLSRTSNVVTVNFNTTKHNLIVGDPIQIFTKGSFSAGQYIVTEIVDDYQLKFSSTGIDDSQNDVRLFYNTGTMSRLTSRMAQRYKALPGVTMDMVTRCSQGKTGASYYFQVMKSNDYTSSLDAILLNVYGEGGNNAIRYTDFTAHIDKLITTFPDITQTGISESGVGSDDSLVPRSDLTSYYSYWKQRIDYIESKTGLIHYIFSDTFPDGGGRNHLSLTQPVRYNTDIEYQPIYDYYLGKTEQSEMILAYTQPSNLMQYSLVNKNYYTDNPTVNQEGYISCPSSGADARILTSKYDFLKTKSYGWLFWYKADDIDAHPINTCIRFGDGGSNGYRILVERISGVDYLEFQDFKTFSTQRFKIPTSINVENWNHYGVCWEGTDANLGNWRPYFYINGIRVVESTASIAFTSLTNKFSGSIFIGHDFNVQNMGGEMTDLAFFYEKFVTANDVWRAIKNRDFTNADSYWPLSGDGTQAADFIGGQHLTLTGDASLFSYPIDISLDPDLDILNGRLGYLTIPGSDDGYARNLLSGYDFLVDASYGVMAWTRTRDIDDHTVNTLWRFGDGSNNGYRILLQRESGVDYLTFQEVTGFTSEKTPLPSTFNPNNWFHWAVTWVGSDNAWTPYFYINGQLISSRSNRAVFANTTQKINGSIYIGTDFPTESLDGDIRDIMFFEQLITQNDVNIAINQRAANNASSYWPCGEGKGNTAYDAIGNVDLTIGQNAFLATRKGRRGRWYTKSKPTWHS